MIPRLRVDGGAKFMYPTWTPSQLRSRSACSQRGSPLICDPYPEKPHCSFKKNQSPTQLCFKLEKHHPNGAKKSDTHFKSPSPQGCKHLFTPQATPLGGQLRTLLYFNNPYKVGPRSGASIDSGVYENVCTAVSLWLRARWLAPLQQLIALSCSYVPLSSDRRTITSLVLFELTSAKSSGFYKKSAERLNISYCPLDMMSSNKKYRRVHFFYKQPGC